MGRPADSSTCWRVGKLTFALAASCPWASGDPFGPCVGMVFIADCQLTGVYPDGGPPRKVSEEARKIFSLGPFTVAAYSGSRWSARHALHRLSRNLFRRRPRPPSNYATLGSVAKYLYKGAIEAQRKSPPPGDGPGAFQVLVGFVDDQGSFALINFRHGAPSSPEEAEILEVNGAPRIVVIGSGRVVAREVADYAQRWLAAACAEPRTIETLPPGHQGAYLAGALSDYLDKKQVPFSGGGIQIMSLDLQEGHRSWALWSTEDLDLAARHKLPVQPGPLPVDVIAPTVEAGFRRHGPQRLPD